MPWQRSLRRLFLQVCLSTGGCAIPACIAGGIPACLAAGLHGGCVVPACLAGFQAHTQGGSLGGSGQREGVGGSPGPHPRGKLRGIWSSPTPKGEVEGDLVGVPTLGEVWDPPWQLLLWAVCILLECILVSWLFLTNQRHSISLRTG